MRRAALALVGLLAVAHIAASARWLGADEGVQFTDAAYHWTQTVELYDGLFGDEEGRRRWALRDDRQRYGEAWYYVAAASARVLGLSAPRVLYALSFLLWPALLFAAFRLGEELAPPGRGPPAGLLSAALAGFLPGLFNYSRVFVLDLPLAVAVAWAAVGFLEILRARHEGLPLRRGVALAAVGTLAGLAIKANAAAFLLGPAWVAARPALTERWRTDRRRFLTTLLGAALVAAGLALILVLSHRADALLETARDATWPGKALDYAQAGTLGAFAGDWARGAWGHSWEAAYFTTLQTLSPPMVFAALGAYLWFFGRRRGCEDPLAHAQRDLVFWWWIVPVIGVTVVLRGLYDERYIVPLLPQVAAVIACAVFEVTRAGPRRALVSVLVLGGALNFAWISFDALPTTRPLGCLTVPGWTATDRVGQDLWLCAGYPDYQFMDRPSEPTWEPWPTDALEEALLPVRDRLGRPLRGVYLDRLYGLFYRVLQRDLVRRDLFEPDSLLLITHCDDPGWIESMFGSLEAVEEVLAASDVVVMRYGAPGAGDPVLRGRRCQVFWSQVDSFSEGGALPLADGTEVRWYLRD